HAVAGLLALLLWLMAGFEVHWAMMGMENGLLGLLLVLSLQLAHRFASTPIDGNAWPAAARRLGVVTALLAITRVDHGLVAALLGFWATVRRAGGGPLWRGIAGARPLWPLPLIVGGWLCASRLCFHEWLPISGSVKLWNSWQIPVPTPLWPA